MQITKLINNYFFCRCLGANNIDLGDAKLVDVWRFVKRNEYHQF